MKFGGQWNGTRSRSVIFSLPAITHNLSFCHMSIFDPNIRFSLMLTSIAITCLMIRDCFLPTEHEKTTHAEFPLYVSVMHMRLDYFIRYSKSVYIFLKCFIMILAKPWIRWWTTNTKLIYWCFVSGGKIVWATFEQSVHSQRFLQTQIIPF